ncbi:MAG: NifB/NifX family molybdenum-iron cluster-binding protein [Methanotrichaceae archaeon]
MKICVTAGALGLDSPVDPRFGRCPFFVIVETEGMTAESVPNTDAGTTGGAGIQAAQAVVKLDVAALITGNIGPNALQTLSKAGIDVYKNLGGSVREAVEQFKREGLQKITSPSAPLHAGMGRGQMGQGPRGQGKGSEGRGGRWS